MQTTTNDTTLDGGIDALIEKLNIKVETPKITDKDLQSATYIMIRHAYSEYNFRE